MQSLPAFRRGAELGGSRRDVVNSQLLNRLRRPRGNVFPAVLCSSPAVVAIGVCLSRNDALIQGRQHQQKCAASGPAKHSDCAGWITDASRGNGAHESRAIAGAMPRCPGVFVVRRQLVSKSLVRFCFALPSKDHKLPKDHIRGCPTETCRLATTTPSESP